MSCKCISKSTGLPCKNPLSKSPLAGNLCASHYNEGINANPKVYSQGKCFNERFSKRLQDLYNAKAMPVKELDAIASSYGITLGGKRETRAAKIFERQMKDAGGETSLQYGRQQSPPQTPNRQSGQSRQSGQNRQSGQSRQGQKPPCYKTMCDLNLTSKASAAKWLLAHKEDSGDHGVHTLVNTCFGSNPKVFCQQQNSPRAMVLYN